MQDMNTRFTEHVKNVLTKAYTFALQSRNASLEPIHLLAALSVERGSVASDLIKKHGLTPEAIKSHFSQGDSPEDEILLDFSENMRKAIEGAARVASKYKHSFIGTEHLLYSLCEIDDKIVEKALKQEDLSLEELRRTLELVFEADSANLKMQGLDLDELIKTADIEEKESDEKALEYFARELTDIKIANELDFIKGRDAEIDRLITILNRRQKNNPILIGYPGVGKTAIVEHVAKLIAENKAPEALKNAKIFEVDLASMIAGTVYRGEFEERIKQLIEEAEADENVILFIDEIHTIIGAGANSGTLDAANILKPALARGKLRCIGATTNDEYRKYISEDQAFARRFQEIRVNEPTKSETVQMLQSSKKYFENFHGVKFSKSTIKRLVDLADEYVPGRFFPDKAVDLLDEVATKIRLENNSSKEIDLEDITNIVANLFGENRNKLKPAEFFKALQRNVRHQDSAIKKLAKKLLKNEIDGKKTRLAVLVSGEEKTGKSHFLNSISDYFFKKQQQLHINGSDYKDDHRVSSLIGTSAGYIGYKDGSLLVDFINSSPNGILIIHEIDKSGPAFKKLIRSLFEGELTSGSGQKVQTSRLNVICSTTTPKEREIGFEGNSTGNAQDTDSIFEVFEDILELKKFSKAELKKELTSSLSKQIKSLKKNLKDIEITPSAKKLVVQKAIKEARGLSDVEKLIDKYLVSPTIDFILENETGKVKVDAVNEDLLIKKKR